MTRKELLHTLDGWLKPSTLADHTVNGLQFEGKGEINKIAFAVDVSLQSIQAACDIQADALITHHGLIWGGLKAIAGVEKQRIALLCEANLNLFCYHMPLDIHPELGNNAVLMKLLGLKRSESIFFEVGYYGECSMPYPELIQRIRKYVGGQIVEMPFGPKLLRRIAFCTGGGGTLPALIEAAAGGADTLFTGETSSIPYHHAKELELNIVCAGHYATEVFGVQALQKKLEQEYPSITTSFLDLATCW